MYEILIVSICGLAIIVASCGSCAKRNKLWDELNENPHGKNRWVIVNKLHRDTGMSRKDIVNSLKR